MNTLKDEQKCQTHRLTKRPCWDFKTATFSNFIFTLIDIYCTELAKKVFPSVIPPTGAVARSRNLLSAVVQDYAILKRRVF